MPAWCDTCDGDQEPCREWIALDDDWWQADAHIAHGRAMGWHHADIAAQALDQDAIRPIDTSGDSVIWKAGVLWSRCPRWHAEHSPYSRQAGAFVAHVERVRHGIDKRPEWTSAGAQLVDTVLSLRSWLEHDRFERGRNVGS